MILLAKDIIYLKPEKMGLCYDGSLVSLVLYRVPASLL
ncbi:hypothetical protein AvCA_43150 [Azotobacter vinelandii CA]|uniref:Uncharacterized protein n=2 Tax=Azotobacter vinelandii TaxID=354 RepID=C1DFP0_AZOVD|nr:hypothetical protein Avin_43150 [Azotobacter vinelandii DJ]AGK14397.1 hypothetical protein AvCA_43150 [Azotobacter vinelandii CA]AGK21915.1 hypothetical protein AvCA6_43150 [Azotobacter vinelandii CA6]